MSLLVLGIGQSFRGDDAVGVDAVHRWQIKYPHSFDSVRVELRESPGVELIDLLVSADMAIIVDALHQPDSLAGSIFQIESENLASFLSKERSTHGWGLAETLHLGCTLYPALRELQVMLIGIVGHDFNPGAGLSPPIQVVLPDVVELIESEVQHCL